MELVRLPVKNVPARKESSRSAGGAGALRCVGRLTATGPRGPWCTLALSAAASRALGRRGAAPIVLSLRGRALRCTALPDGAGGHVVLFNARMRAETGARAGERVAIEVALDRSSREQPLPGDLAAALEADAVARAAFESLPPSLQREIAQWLARAKRPETRVRRLDRVLRRVVEVAAERAARRSTAARRR